jgi:hypothetical protein
MYAVEEIICIPLRRYVPVSTVDLLLFYSFFRNIQAAAVAEEVVTAVEAEEVDEMVVAAEEAVGALVVLKSSSSLIATKESLSLEARKTLW